jgi:hypothetical protein
MKLCNAQTRAFRKKSFSEEGRLSEQQGYKGDMKINKLSSCPYGPLYFFFSSLLLFFSSPSFLPFNFSSYS